jgi:hypothetical protein
VRARARRVECAVRRACGVMCLMLASPGAHGSDAHQHNACIGCLWAAMMAARTPRRCAGGRQAAACARRGVCCAVAHLHRAQSEALHGPDVAPQLLQALGIAWGVAWRAARRRCERCVRVDLKRICARRGGQCVAGRRPRHAHCPLRMRVWRGTSA